MGMQEYNDNIQEQIRLKNIRIEAFVDMLEEHTSYFDDLCDCPYGDGVSNEHTDNCYTMNIRKDLAYARTGVR